MTNITQIENMTAAQIKENRDAAVQCAAETDIKTLAARYVQARLDAKMRDEELAISSGNCNKLAEQNARLNGEVTSNKAAISALKEQVVGLLAQQK